MRLTNLAAIALMTLSLNAATPAFRKPNGAFRGMEQPPAAATSKNRHAAAADSSYRIIPFVANGEANGRFTATEIGVVNTTGLPAEATVLFVDKNGESISLPLMSESGDLDGRFKGARATIDPRGGASVTTYPEKGTSTVAWAIVQITPANSLEVYTSSLVFNSDDVSILNGAVSTVDRTGFTGLPYSVEDSKTRLAIVNTGEATETMQVIVRGMDGSEACRFQATVGSMQQAVVDVDKSNCRGASGTNWIDIAASKTTIAVGGFADMGIAVFTPIMGR